MMSQLDTISCFFNTERSEKNFKIWLDQGANQVIKQLFRELTGAFREDQPKLSPWDIHRECLTALRGEKKEKAAFVSRYPVGCKYINDRVEDFSIAKKDFNKYSTLNKLSSQSSLQSPLHNVFFTGVTVDPRLIKKHSSIACMKKKMKV